MNATTSRWRSSGNTKAEGCAANTAFAQYFIGNSYLNPLTKPGESTVGLEPVDDEAYSKLQ